MAAPPTARLSHDVVAELAASFEGREPQDVLRWGLEQFGSRLALSTSFQAEGMALLDMAWRIDPAVRVITIDTGRLPAETYALVDQVRERYGITIEVFYPDAAELETFTGTHGMNAFYRSITHRLTCCDIRKVNPLKRALGNFDAWVNGRRRAQTDTRRAIPAVEIDELHGGIVKLNPLAGWSGEQVWDYIREHDVPVSALYAQGYTSIGCAPCTRPTQPGEDPRAGRWWWEEDLPKECGIHLVLRPT